MDLVFLLDMYIIEVINPEYEHMCKASPRIMHTVRNVL